MAHRIRRPVCFTLSEEAISGLMELSIEYGLNKSAMVEYLVVQALDRTLTNRERTVQRFSENKLSRKLPGLFGGVQ